MANEGGRDPSPRPPPRNGEGEEETPLNPPREGGKREEGWLCGQGRRGNERMRDTLWEWMWTIWTVWTVWTTDGAQQYNYWASGRELLGERENGE